jgi:hypothetical protein
VSETLFDCQCCKKRVVELCRRGGNTQELGGVYVDPAWKKNTSRIVD